MNQNVVPNSFAQGTSYTTTGPESYTNINTPILNASRLYFW